MNTDPLPSLLNEILLVKVTLCGVDFISQKEGIRQDCVGT